MFMSKAESVRWAAELGALESLAYSHTCYEGEFPPCGTCPACRLRRKGFARRRHPRPPGGEGRRRRLTAAAVADAAGGDGFGDQGD